MKPQKGLPQLKFWQQEAPRKALTNYAPLDMVLSRLTASISLIRFS